MNKTECDGCLKMFNGHGEEGSHGEWFCIGIDTFKDDDSAEHWIHICRDCMNLLHDRVEPDDPGQYSVDCMTVLRDCIRESVQDRAADTQVVPKGMEPY